MLPAMTKDSWRESGAKRAYVEAALAVVEEALGEGGPPVDAAYRELSFLIDRHLAEDWGLLPRPTIGRWSAALGRIHVARFGFWGARPTPAQLEAALPEIAPERLVELARLGTDVAEFADGGTRTQLANELVKYAKKNGVTVSRGEALRVIAALEGGPIPP